MAPEEKQKLIASINANVRRIHDDCVGRRENPHIIALAQEFLRLTNSPEDNAALDEALEASAGPKCPHEVVNRRTGKCVACNEVVE